MKNIKFIAILALCISSFIQTNNTDKPDFKLEYLRDLQNRFQKCSKESGRKQSECFSVLEAETWIIHNKLLNETNTEIVIFRAIMAGLLENARKHIKYSIQ